MRLASRNGTGSSRQQALVAIASQERHRKGCQELVQEHSIFKSQVSLVVPFGDIPLLDDWATRIIIKPIL